MSNNAHLSSFLLEFFTFYSGPIHVPASVSFKSLSMTSIVSMQLRTMKYHVCILNTIQYNTGHYDDLTKRTIVQQTPFVHFPSFVFFLKVELYPFESFLAEFGGALGLFTGFSFMFFADLADAVLKFLLKGVHGGNTILK